MSAPRQVMVALELHADFDVEPVTVRGYDDRGDPVEETLHVPATTPRNIVLWTGRSEWAVRVQLNAIARREARGQRTASLRARLLTPRRGHRARLRWAVSSAKFYASVESIVLPGSVFA